MNNSIEQLQNYRDKCFIYNILCERSSEYYSHLKSIVNIPLIISSSIMTILNSGSFDAESMKVPNIVINAMTVLLMSLINNFKVVEKCSNFKALTLKYQQLLHYIEDKLANDKNIDGENVREIVKLYDDLASQNEFSIPNHIKNKIKQMYHGKQTLPNILNCETNFVNQVVIEETKIKSNLVFTDTPRVLDIKHIQNLQL